MENIKVSANYIPQTDKYILYYSNMGSDGFLASENGEELVEKAKKELGVNMRYDKEARKFSVPQEHRF